jgi:hypothetical protein
MDHKEDLIQYCPNEDDDGKEEVLLTTMKYRSHLNTGTMHNILFMPGNYIPLVMIAGISVALWLLLSDGIALSILTDPRESRYMYTK